MKLNNLFLIIKKMNKGEISISDGFTLETAEEMINAEMVMGLLRQIVPRIEDFYGKNPPSFL